MATSRARAALLGRDGARGLARALLALAVLAATAALAAAGCGGSGTSSRAAATATTGTAAPGASAATTSATTAARRGASAAFAWLHPMPPPPGWRRARIAAGVVLAYPPGWRTAAGDLGTATVGLRDARGRYVGYLNLTPRQGDETLANWAAFRVGHQREEGERDVQRQGAAKDVRFGGGRASCVQDAYTTVIGARYVELACLVRGARASTVVVGAALQRSWPAQRSTLERAIAALST